MKGLGAAAASAAVITICGASGAFAADLNNMPVKAVPISGPTLCTSILDFFTTACQVSAYGVRFYGTVDVGGGYQTNGAKFDNLGGVDYFLQKNSFGGKWLASPNALSTSNVGLQIKEPLAAGWSFVGQVETGFNPYSLEVLNGVHTVVQHIGQPLLDQPSFGDSNSQGQFYNDLGFFGFSNDTWGTLTFFRQNSLIQDMYLAYDPMGLSAAFSPLGFFGTYAGGGDTENRRDTTAIKYRVNVANWHFGAYGQVGGYDEGNASKGTVSGNLGADYKIGPGILSGDVVGAWRKDAVSLGTDLVGPVNQFGMPINAATSTSETASATISNNTTVTAAAKYTVDRLRLYAGYEWIQFTNPSDPTTDFTDIAGDQFCTGACGTTTGTTISNTAYNFHRITQVAWFGGRYGLTDSLDLSAAYYHVWQNDYSGGAKNANQAAEPELTCSQSSTSSSKCAGTQDSVSLVLDWKFSPKWDTYIGTMYSRNTGGIDNGFLSSNTWETTAGLRFRW
jgi:predicted porin